MVKTDTYAKLLSALAALSIISIIFGVIVYIILRSSPYWSTAWYDKHINPNVGYATTKRKFELVASCCIIGGIAMLFIIEMFSQVYLEKRRKDEFILTHLQIQVEKMKSEI